MFTSAQSSVRGSLGPLNGGLSVVNAANLGTTITKVLAGADPNASAPRMRRARIIVVSATGNLAFQLVTRNGTAPTGQADGDGSSDEQCLILQAMKFLDIIYDSTLDLYLVASAASTAYQVQYRDE